VAKTTSSKKTAAKKTIAKKAIVKKTAAKKTTARKAAVKKTPAKTATVKKTAVKKAATRKAAAKKSSVRKTAVATKALKTTASSKKPAKKAVVSPKSAVTNTKLKGMIQTNLDYASRAKKPVFVDSEVMPQDYGSTSITLLARDPHWVHAYWEIAHADDQHLRDRIGAAAKDAVYALRVYDTTLIEFDGSNANHWFDIDVGRDASNWYINFWSDNITCCAEIGLRTAGGDFHALARSNFVTTPREHLSPRNEIIWMDVQPQEEARPYVYAGREPDSGGEDQLQPGVGRRLRMYLTAEDIRAYYSRLFPLLSKVLAARGRRKNRGVAVGEDDVVEPDGELLLEYLEDMDLLGYDYFKEIILGASEKRLLRSRAVEEIQAGGASEEILSSWSASQDSGAQKDFFFELGTELIVYGRTEPDAVVFWGDRMVPLREDGTFTLRMALPTDTHIPLDFKAISYRKDEQRSIVTAAGRDKTEYSQ